MSAIGVSNRSLPHVSDDASLQALPEQCENELLTHAKAGDVGVFLELVQPHMKYLRAMSYSILQNHADAEDVEQETLLKALCHLDQVRNGPSFGGWLLRIGANEARRFLRRRRLSPSVDSDDSPSEDGKQLPKELADSRELPSMRLERKELWTAIGKILSSLDRIYRDVLLLRDVQQLSVSQAATILEISEACVKTRLHRARVQMREQLAPAFHAPKGMWVSVQPTLNGTCKPMRSLTLNPTAICHLPKYIDGQLNRREIAEMQKTLRLSRTPKMLIDSTHRALYVLADNKVFIPPFDYDDHWDELLSSLPATA
jgi:RNA polymerase sigma-70 factor (ECF subfamily)